MEMLITDKVKLPRSIELEILSYLIKFPEKIPIRDRCRGTTRKNKICTNFINGEKRTNIFCTQHKKILLNPKKSIFHKHFILKKLSKSNANSRS